MLTAKNEYSLKNTLKIFNFLLSLFSLPVLAESYLKAYPDRVLPGERVNFETTSGFHFEMAAPQKCAEAAPSAKSPRRIACQFGENGEKQVLLSICDDAKTFCKPTNLKLHVQGEGKANRPPMPSAALAAAQMEIKKKIIPGFHFSTPSEVLATKFSGPVLVMVSTDWCPPCNDMKENVLSTSAFTHASEGWHKVYVDGDSMASVEWNKTAAFHFFPTFIALNGKLEEIGRYWGPTRLHEFKQWLNEIKALTGDPINALKERVLARKNRSLKQWFVDLLQQPDKESERRRLIKWSLLAQDKPSVAIWQKNDVPQDLLYFWYRYQLATAENPTDNERLELMTSAVENARGMTIFSEELAQLCGASIDSCKKFVTELPDRFEWLNKQVYAAPNEKDAAIGQEAAYHIQMYQKLGDEARVRLVAERCIKAAEAEAKASPLGLSRNANIYLSYCLEGAGRDKDAEKVYAELVAAYPTESTFLLRYGNYFRRRKRFKEALMWADRAVQAGYGYNWLKAVYLKADMEIALNDKAAALKTIRSAIAELELTSKAATDRDQSWASALRALERKLTPPKS